MAPPVRMTITNTTLRFLSLFQNLACRETIRKFRLEDWFGIPETFTMIVDSVRRD